MNYNGLSDGRGGSVGASFPTNNSKLKPGTKGIPTKEYDRSQLSKKELSDNYVATVTDVMNEVFVVEGGTCECNKGIDPAKIKNTQSASTSFGGKKALTVSCVKMEGEIFGACKKLTEENDKKKGKKCPPIMCKGKFKPVPDKWLDPVASVSSNGEEVIAVYSKLKCEHGGTIHITRNGQGGLYDQGYVNFEVSKEFAWAFTPFAASGYQLYTGRNMNDWSVMTKTETGIQVAYFILDGVTVFSIGKKMVSSASKSNKVFTSLELADGANSEFKSIITPEMEEKILWGKRKNPNQNKIIGGHSPKISNGHPNYAVEDIMLNPDGTKKLKFTTQFPDGNLAKIKTTTVFPEGWSNGKILESSKNIGNKTPISVRSSDGATWHRSIVDGVEIDVIKRGNEIISAYPTGTVSGPPPVGFSK